MAFDVQQFLMNYGVLGCWTGWLIYEKTKILDSFRSSQDKLIEAVNKLSFMIEKSK